ncbi:MAG: DM13 domain-containing protein [Acidimicrobiales bacterium]
MTTGALRGIGHDATGTASLIRSSTGRLVVRFEDFDIEGTPDPFVYLVDGADVQELSGVALGHLDGNQGDVLDYDVPAGIDAGAGWTVLVWCRSFAVPIANATHSSV